MRESEATSQARRALGAELAAYRRAAGYSQAQLAALTDFSRSTVANVETGRQHVPRDFWERADSALRTGGVLAIACDEVEAVTRRERQAVARSLSKARRAHTWQQDTDRPASVPAHAGTSTTRPGAVPPWFLVPSLASPVTPDVQTAPPPADAQRYEYRPRMARWPRTRQARGQLAQAMWPGCAACAST